MLLAPVGLSAVAYLVCYYGATGGSGVCCNHHAAVEETADNGRSRARRLGQRHALGVEGCIAVVVGEVEAAHGVGAELSRREGVVRLLRRLVRVCGGRGRGQVRKAAWCVCARQLRSRLRSCRAWSWSLA